MEQTARVGTTVVLQVPPLGASGGKDSSCSAGIVHTIRNELGTLPSGAS